MEGWENGIMDEKRIRFFKKDPSFHYSNIPASQL
jgi:hypothetical protein